jgi:protein-tyrosine phosphatase
MKFPPAQLAYIVYRRLLEQGVEPMRLWLRDKIVRRMTGFSPREISEVQPRLYVGGQHTRRGLTRMLADGIGAVVNMREESDDAKRGAAPEHYLWLPTTDDHAPTPEDLARGVGFITEHIAAERGVYVHCASGVGRAPTMAAAYLVSTGLKPAAAWSAIRARRPFIRPTPPQIEAVATYAAQRMVSKAESEPEQEPETRPSPDPEAESTPPPNAVGVSFSLSQPTSSDAPSKRRPEAIPGGEGLPVEPSREAPMNDNGDNGDNGDEEVEAREQLAYERIMMDPNLTGDLMDEDATVLLDWAQDEVGRLVAETKGMDEDAAWEHLGPKLSQLRREIRKIAKRSAQADDPGAKLRELLDTYPDESGGDDGQ